MPWLGKLKTKLLATQSLALYLYVLMFHSTLQCVIVRGKVESALFTSCNGITAIHHDSLAI